MREMVKMVIILTALSTLSGGLLAALKSRTQERIDSQVLEFVKGPAIRTILNKVSNDPIADRFTIKKGDIKETFFVGKVDGKPSLLAFEASGTGFGGPVGMMVGINVDTGKIIGTEVTTHNETPGVGANVENDTAFVGQFAGLPVNSKETVTKDGGKITAMSGATITSRAVCAAVTRAGEIYEKMKPEIEEKLKSFSG
ncbi:MAG: RnfABCDGE type electron transport complex subunit G [Deltaproteobacteria bacterium]|nr:RnfABCDGE type electron transport complex subunit G [Deltaproteobacteria bacterium]